MKYHAKWHYFCIFDWQRSMVVHRKICGKSGQEGILMLGCRAKMPDACCGANSAVYKKKAPHQGHFNSKTAHDA